MREQGYSVPMFGCASEGGYLGDGRAPDRNDVARHLVEIPADELQWLRTNNTVDQVDAIQQGWHRCCKCAKVVCQSLQRKASNILASSTCDHKQ